MSELFIVVAITAKPGKEDELRRDLTAVVEPSRKEPGCLRYELFVDQGQRGRFVFVEHWASREARDTHHNEGPHIRHFEANGGRNIASYELVTFLDRIA